MTKYYMILKIFFNWDSLPARLIRQCRTELQQKVEKDKKHIGKLIRNSPRS